MWSRERRSRAMPSRKAGSGRRALQMKKSATMVGNAFAVGYWPAFLIRRPAYVHPSLRSTRCPKGLVIDPDCLIAKPGSGLRSLLSRRMRPLWRGLQGSARAVHGESNQRNTPRLVLCHPLSVRD